MNTTWNESLALTCRRMFLRNYEININIGIHEFEKKGDVFAYNYITRNRLKNSLTLSNEEVQKLIEKKGYTG